MVDIYIKDVSVFASVYITKRGRKFDRNNTKTFKRIEMTNTCKMEIVLS